MAPTVSVNLCCYNSEKYLEATLQSIFAQTYTDWELVVVNDGSTDATERIVKRHMDVRPIVYHYQENAGLGSARNKAIALSRGSFIAIIDHDDLWHPAKLAKQMALFHERPSVAVAYSNAFRLYPDGGMEVNSKPFQMYRGNVLAPLALNDFIVCSTIVMRRSALDEVGWFDNRFTQVEEYDLLIRIAEKYEFDYVDEPLASWRVHDRNASWDSSRIQAESVTLMRESLRRSPHLRRVLGSKAARIKLAGLYCTLGHSYLLRGRFGEARRWYGSTLKALTELARAAALYLLSLLPHAVVTKVVGWRSARSRRLALRRT